MPESSSVPRPSRHPRLNRTAPRRTLRVLAAAVASGLLVPVAAPAGLDALAPAAARAAPTDLDGGFGTGGVARVARNGNQAVRAVLTQADGGVVGIGPTSGSTSPDGMVFRLGPNGRLDPGFAGDGVRVLDSGDPEALFGAALQPDGKIVAVGFSGSDAIVYRLHPDGSLDASFDDDGWRLLDSGGAETAYDVAVQPDGRIVVAGSTSVSGGGDVAVYRLRPDGSLDPSFDGDGARGLDSGARESAGGVALQPDGRIVVAGTTLDAGTGDGVVYRLHPDGSPDTTFDGDGTAVVPGQGLQALLDVAVQPDGAIVVAGVSGTSALVARLTAAGALDPAFGEGGSRAVTGGGASVEAIALQPDGTIVGAGLGLGGPLVFRVTREGSVDEAFPAELSAALRTVGLGTGRAVAVRPGGRILVAGESPGADPDAVVVQLVGDVPAPQPEPSGGDAGGGVAPTGAGAPGDPRSAPRGPGLRPRTSASRVRCAGRRATIVGTAGRDRIRGTRDRDVIAALGGDDTVLGLAGDDVVCGGPGDDDVRGGAGRDDLRGEAGRDRLSGGAGRDRLSGGAGRDRLSGGAGRDRLSGGAGRDRVSQA